MESTPYPNYDEQPDGPPVPKRLYAARPWTIVLTALLTELVVIAAVGNQAVSKRFTDYLNDHITSAPDYTVGAFKALLVFAWRFAPADGQATHEWAAAFAGIGTLLVLTWLLVWIVARGSVTFPRIWVTVAAIVAAVTPISIMVRNVVLVPERPGPLQSKVGQAIYGYAEFGPAIVAGVVLGVVVGLFAALLAVITRRSVEFPRIEVPVAAPINAYGMPESGYEPPAWGSAPINPAYEDAPTQYVPSYAEDAPTISTDAPTQYVPAVPDTPYAPPPVPTPEPEPTGPEPPSTGQDEAPSTEQTRVLEGEPPRGERRSVQVGEDEDDTGPTTDEIPAVTQTLPPVKD